MFAMPICSYATGSWKQEIQTRVQHTVTTGLLLFTYTNAYMLVVYGLLFTVAFAEIATDKERQRERLLYDGTTKVQRWSRRCLRRFVRCFELYPIVNMTCPDLAFTYSDLSKYVQSPGLPHMHAAEPLVSTGGSD
jgi:hypothetical protein